MIEMKGKLIKLTADASQTKKWVNVDTISNIHVGNLSNGDPVIVVKTVDGTRYLDHLPDDDIDGRKLIDNIALAQS